MSLFQRPSLWHHITSWDRIAATAGVKRLATGSVLVTDRELAHKILTSDNLYREQSAFLRTRSWDPLPPEARNAAIRGLMSALDRHRQPPPTVPGNVFPGGRRILTQSWGIWWMRHLFRDALAADRPAIFDTCIDRFVKRKILGDDIGGSFRRMPSRDRDGLHSVLGTAIEEVTLGSCDRGDLVDVIATLDLDLPTIELGELYVRLVHSVISFTGTALEWAVIMAAQNSDLRMALQTGDTIRPFLLELQRLYPTAWRLVRVVGKDHEIGDERVTAGDDIVVATSTVQRCEEYWDKSKEYVPGRWSDADVSRNRAYMPFGRGRGMCPGREVALEAIQDSLCWIYRHYEISLVPRARWRPYVRSVLAPPRLSIRVRRRGTRNLALAKHGDLRYPDREECIEVTR